MSKRFRLSIAIAVSLLFLGGAFQNCAEGLPAAATASPSSTPSGILPASAGAPAFKTKVRIGSARQNADVSSIGTDWKDIPGAAFAFTLATGMTVELRANGSATPTAGVTYSSVHCGVRFVVDGAPLGNPTWGDVIVGINACSASTSCWTPWTATRELDLAPGPHSVQVQMTGWPGADSACHISGQDFSAARLSIEAF